MDHRIVNPGLSGYVAVDSQHQSFSFTHSIASPAPSPAVSDSVFSATSEASSHSSIGDSDEDAHKIHIVSEAQKTQHQHPRRTSATKTPPSLPRQEERKVLFVNDLVDSATSLVSVIWPLSGGPCAAAPSRTQVLPLRRYIEETLRRSRTSYSTLQVALYYLILIKDHVAFETANNNKDDAERRAMRCGRRMFLSALILASKYLQDRNYSAKAWSKMSGLKTTEINSNERLFLAAVDWKLHIADAVFKRWTDIVLRFTAPPASLTSAVFDSKAAWAQVIPLLTPALDDPSIMTLPVATPIEVAPSPPATGILTPVATPPPTSPADSTSPATISLQTICPRFLEPRPDILPPTPGLARMCRLTTPFMTPALSVGGSTPAASVAPSRRPSFSLARMSLDSSFRCSPESMITDRSSRCESVISMPPPRREVINVDLVSGTASHPIVLDSPELTVLDHVRHKKRLRDEQLAPLDLTAYECMPKRVCQSVEDRIAREVVVIDEK